jgi:hypothetical protein
MMAVTLKISMFYHMMQCSSVEKCDVLVDAGVTVFLRDIL